ncbi:FAD:protein FMN transferase [Microbacterium sp. KSW4-11]|uniref:FAD:protein FMN transferase n=1 Tax=Microbacterium gawkjiense TaxID=3067309 RepID=A0ABU3GDE3_9MICO|nr:FAD:protein FMN transferase [Microbacterium sp. KSW4-11]MDT3317511.1 FAD:protein FMN transferase [Microbacterium sp. KSW4-11]
MTPAGPLVHSWTFEAIGTVWRIDTADPLDDGVREEITDAIAVFDGEWSRFREDSLVRRLGESGGEVPAPADAGPMLDAYDALDSATSGAVNPLVGESLARRGYDAEYSLIDRGAVAAPQDWRAIVDWSDAVLRLTEPAVLDVGALGKGRLVDIVIARIPEGAAVVDAGGDIAVRGATQRIALEHPYDTSRAIGVWQVTDAALCASAVNRRAWGDGLHHVLDARTGEPVRAYAATWAVASDAMTADAVATALFFDGGPRLAAEWGVAWVRMRTDGSVEWSPRCEAELFS